MTKRLLLLGGLAIVAVVLNHAAGYGQIALFLWADSYLPVEVPYWAALGSLADWSLIAVRSIGAFAVPAFLFISGFFSVYMVGSDQPAGQTWRAVWRRVTGLTIPYLIWSFLIFVMDALQGIVYDPAKYGVKLLTTGASGHLFYVPLLCTCYILSPWIVKLARRRPRLLLCALALLQMAALAMRYLRGVDPASASGAGLTWVPPAWSLPWWVVYFALGAVVAVKARAVREILVKCRWTVLGLSVISWLLNILEGHYLLATYRVDWLAGVGTVTYNLFAISMLASLVAFADIPAPCSKMLYWLGGRSYGVYLMHMPIIGLLARVLRKVAPEALGYQILLVPLLFVGGFGFPLLAMEAMHKWSVDGRVYRYLFG